MNISEQIKVLCTRKGISMAELARKIGQSPQNFNAKLKRNTVTEEEIQKICMELNVKYHHFFELNDGERIE